MKVEFISRPSLEMGISTNRTIFSIGNNGRDRLSRRIGGRIGGKDNGRIGGKVDGSVGGWKGGWIDRSV